jgi:hypothetical protein
LVHYIVVRGEIAYSSDMRSEETLLEKYEANESAINKVGRVVGRGWAEFLLRRQFMVFQSRREDEEFEAMREE